MRDAEKEDDRQQRGGAEPDHQRDRRAAGAERGIEIRQIGPRQRQAADNPGDGKCGGDEIGRAGRTPLQRVQDLADRLLIVVGGVRRGAGKIARADRVGTEEVVAGRRGRTLGAAVGGAGQQIGHALGLACGLLFVLSDIEGFLDRRQRRLGRIRHLLWIVGHFGRRLACYA